MTKISIRYEEKEIVKRVVEEVSTVVLELSEDEAKFIHDVLMRIGGDPWKSRRMHAQTILDALWSIYPEGKSKEFYDDFDLKRPGFFFNETNTVL